jgi:hypothetical protein
MGKISQARKSFANALAILQTLPDAQRLEHADGLTAADLRDLANFHLTIPEAREHSHQ